MSRDVFHAGVQGGRLHNVKIPPHTRIVAGRDVVFCDMGEEAVALSLSDGVYYGLKGVAIRVWELIQEPRTLQEVHELLFEEYQVDEETCARDLVDLVLQLRERGLAELQNGKLNPGSSEDEPIS